MILLMKLKGIIHQADESRRKGRLIEWNN
jgi:hypothetical protein